MKDGTLGLCIRDLAVINHLDHILYVNHLDIDALIYIQAALDAKVFNCKPPFPVLDKEFQGHLGAQSLFYDYVGYDSYKFERQAMELENATKILKQITDK